MRTGALLDALIGLAQIQKTDFAISMNMTISVKFGELAFPAFSSTGETFFVYLFLKAIKDNHSQIIRKIRSFSRFR